MVHFRREYFRNGFSSGLTTRCTKDAGVGVHIRQGRAVLRSFPRGVQWSCTPGFHASVPGRGRRRARQSRQVTYAASFRPLRWRVGNPKAPTPGRRKIDILLLLPFLTPRVPSAAHSPTQCKPSRGSFYLSGSDYSSVGRSPIPLDASPRSTPERRCGLHTSTLPHHQPHSTRLCCTATLPTAPLRRIWISSGAPP